MKYLIAVVLLSILCPLTARGQVSITIPEALVSVSDTLKLPLNINIPVADSVTGIRVKVEFEAEKFESLGYSKNGSISDSLLTAINTADSSITISFASIHPIRESGVLTYLLLVPKNIGLTRVVLGELRIDENPTEFPNAESDVLITDATGNTPPFIIDVPDTLILAAGKPTEIALDNYYSDYQEDFADLQLEVDLEEVNIGFSVDLIEKILTLTTTEEEGIGTLTLVVTDSGGASLEISIVIVVKIFVSNEETEFEKGFFALSQNYPNPFNPSTQISFSLPTANLVKLDVINTLGQRVATLVNERKAAGNYTVNFNASHLSSGVYFYTIQAGGFQQTRKMLLIK